MNSLTPAGVALVAAQFRNAGRKRPSWTNTDKALALAIYKRGPRAYRFLKEYLKMPSKTTLQNILKNIPLKTGINQDMFLKLKKRVEKFNPSDRVCSVTFDEIALSTGFTYAKNVDEVIGYVDLGSLGKRNEPANHALVFMVQGIRKSWKQPVAYYFTKDTVQSQHLRILLKDVITALQSVGLNIIATICDQGPTNVSCIKQLISESRNETEDPIFYINGQKIIAIHDPPHLLKLTRNALFKYNIRYETKKVAKMEHIINCYRLDQQKRFQCMRKIRPYYFKLDSCNALKMKVSIAAKTLSNTVAATLEAMISNNSQVLPAEAIHTAEFVHDADQLFDSFNGRSIRPDNAKILRCAVSSKSKHICFWNDMLRKVSTWQFEETNSTRTRLALPFKNGWIQTIRGVKEIWRSCKAKGFKYLRTRSLNQDALENLFASIRQCGAANTNPTCYQFISALKTSIINNLTSFHSYGANCEKDGFGLLDNMQDFLDVPSTSNAENIIGSNEVFDLNITHCISNLQDSNFDTQATSYVCGYFVKMIGTNCDKCKASLFSQVHTSHHLFTMFKEADEHERLLYVTRDLVQYVATMYDAIYFILEKLGHIPHIKAKIIAYLSTLNFDWFGCSDHWTEIKTKLLDIATSLIIKKYYEDLKRQFQISNRKQMREKTH